MNSYEVQKALASARLLTYLPWCKDKRAKWVRRRDKKIWRYVEKYTPKIPELTEEEKYLVENNPYDEAHR